MRNIILGLAIASFMGIAGLATASAAPAGVGGPSTVTATDGTLLQVTSNYCRRLRHACKYKYERGEAGKGNCRRYRNECSQETRCQRLRRACAFKYERGESGEGNCRRYRNECGG